ncbi:MAG TPA: hypothetical protein VLV18_00185 [Terriglobales bacterium]|nr:hypothetical protein [Terriglobales bacterium]
MNKQCGHTTFMMPPTGHLYVEGESEMSMVYFVTPVMMPAEVQRPQPILYYPINYFAYRFPVPVLYPTPPIAVL